ncbi:MAG: tetratricopeptide repeat protein [Pseudomonadales bacterium]|nr:tetratricopeptide repeat protein [Pseudomonadales bacterium]
MPYQIGPFLLDLETAELHKDSKPVGVEPQVLEVLGALVTRRDQMVTKQDLIDQVWGGRFVSDAALSSRIKSARQALEDDGRQQRMIKTIHGRGFRFVGPVEEVSNSPVPVAVEKEPARPVVAVLDFENLSSEAGQDYFVNGITQDISNILARNRWLDVLARNALRPYLGAVNLYEALREEAGVDYVLEGSVRRAGEAIRVSTTLVSTDRGHTHWSETYDRSLHDIFQLQDEITRTIASRVEPEIGLAERQRVGQLPQRDLKAWDCYHLGVDRFFQFTAQSNVAAQELLERSRTLDPNFAEAHAWWAYSVVLGMVYWDTPVSRLQLDEALDATERAVSLDSRNAVLYALMARVRLARGEYDSAIRENQRAIDLNPALASAHCGLADSLAYEGRYDESIETFEHVIKLSTNDPQRWAFFTYGAMAMIFSGEYERAVEWCDEALVIPNRQYWTLAHKLVALALLGREQEVITVRELLLKEKSDFSVAFAKEKLFYVKRDDQLDNYLKALKLAGID